MVIGNDIIGTISESISLENGVIETYVSVSNRAYIENKNNVEILVLGLNQADYGLIKGKIIEISADSFATEKEIFFKVYIKPEKLLLNKKEKKVKVTNGQYAEIRIKHNKTTWLKWGLSKIGII